MISGFRSVMDGVPVKISERCRPPARVHLPAPLRALPQLEPSSQPVRPATETEATAPRLTPRNDAMLTALSKNVLYVTSASRKRTYSKVSFYLCRSGLLSLSRDRSWSHSESTVFAEVGDGGGVGKI